MEHILNIKILESCPNRELVENYYLTKVNQLSYQSDNFLQRDCGIDLIFPDNFVVQTHDVKKCGLGIACEFFPNGREFSGGFKLLPRSSISNTPLSLANSEGVIDPLYRGELIVPLRCHLDRRHPSTIDNGIYQISVNDRLVQIIAPDYNPIKVNVVQNLSETSRGSSGFGSTNSK